MHRFKNKFSFFACHVRKPYSHKAFRRFQAGNFPEKLSARSSIPADHQQESKASNRQVVRTKRETQAGNPRGTEWIGKEMGRNERGRNERNKRHGNLFILSRKYPQQASDSCRSPCAFLSRCFPDKNSIITRSEICQAKNPAKFGNPWNIPWNIFLSGLVRTD